MAIKVFDTQDAVPETIRASAVEVGGKWVAEEVDASLGDAGKRALQAEREKASAAEAARRAAEKERDDLKREAEARESGVTAEQLAKIRADEAAARKPLEEENTRLAAQLRKVTHTDRVQLLALKYGVMPDRIEDAMLTLAQRTDLTSDGEGIVVKGKDGSLTTETVDDFLSKTFKTEKPWLYAGTGSNGGGSAGSEGAGGVETGSAEAVAAGKAAAAQQKKTAADNALAFK